MKLSEAIRVGSGMSLPLDNGDLKSKDCLGNLYACALMAAHLGVGGAFDMQDRDIYDALERTWPILLMLEFDELLEREDDLGTRIWTRNDAFMWDREKIAAWLEGLGY